MGKRYKAIRKALYYARKKDAQGNLTGTPVIDPDSPLAQYREYKNEDIILSYERAEDSKPEELIEVVLLPFAHLAAGDTQKYIVKMSKRVLDTTSVSSVVTAGNVVETIAEGDKKAAGYKPAKAIVSILDSTQTVDSRQSQITGIKYDPVNKSSYTIPLGATTGKHWMDVKNSVLTAVKAISPGKGTVRFKNEVI